MSLCTPENSAIQKLSIIIIIILHLQEKEKEMLNRVVQKRDEVQKLNRNFSTLLEQDAKRQGTEGTNNIPNLSPQELKEKFHSVNKDYMKMAKSISANAQLPD